MGRVLIYLGVLITPVLYSSTLSYSGEFPKFMALLILSILAGALFIFSAMKSPVHRFVESPLLSLIILFLLGYILSAIFSIHPIASIFGNRGTWATSIVGIMGACTIALVSANFFKRNNSAYHLLVYLTLSGFFTSLLFLGAKYLLPMLGLSKTYSSFLPIPNMENLTFFLVITSATSMSLLLDPLAKHLRPVIALVLIVQVISAIIAGSSLSTFVMAIGMILLPLAIFSAKRQTRRRGGLIVLVLSIFIVFGTILLSLPSLQSKLPENIKKSAIVSEITSSLSSWEPGLRIFLRHPLTGTGPELVNAELLKESKEFVQDHLSEKLVTYSFSNSYITLLATTGIAGTLPFILIASLLIYLIYKADAKLEYEGKSLLLVSLVFILSLSVHTLSSLSVLVGFIVLGACAAHIPFVRYTNRTHTPSKWYNYLLVGIVLAYLGYHVFSFVKAENLYMRSTTEKSPDNLDSITDAIEYNPYESAYYRAQIGYLIQYLRKDPTGQNSSEIERQIRQSIDTSLIINPYNYLNSYSASLAYSDLALIFDRPAYYVTSLSYLSAAIEKSPYDQRLYLRRGIIFLEMNNDAAAMKDFDKAISIDKTKWVVYLNAAQALQESGRYDKATTYLKTVIEKSEKEESVRKAQQLLDRVQVEFE